MPASSSKAKYEALKKAWESKKMPEVEKLLKELKVDFMIQTADNPSKSVSFGVLAFGSEISD